MSQPTPVPPSTSQSATAPPPRRGPALVATNSVTTKDGLTVRARIDPTLVSTQNDISVDTNLTSDAQSVADVIKQLCLNLKISGNPMLYALRDAGEGDELVTDENLRKKIRDKAPL
ncbi:12734_t:CDS:1, partial [Acaulospora colombiana]